MSISSAAKQLGLKKSDAKPPARKSPQPSPSKDPTPTVTIKISRPSEKTQDVLDKCKEFFTHDNRLKVIRLCEVEDICKNEYIPLMTFGRILRYVGFRLLFEEVKSFVEMINIYAERNDRVFYGKLVSALMRKLMRGKPYLVFARPSQVAAVMVIQRYYLKKKNVWLRPGVRNPGIVLRELAKKLHEANEPMLRCFESAERKRCGYLEVSDFDQILKTHDIETNFEEAKEAFRVLDSRKCDKINYENFITGIESYFFAFDKIEPNKPLDSDNKIKEILSNLKGTFKETAIPCEIMFKLFDQHNKGVISFDNFTSILQKIGAKFSQSELRQIFDKADTGKDGVLSFVEYATAFFDLNESPVEILNRLEAEEKMRKELEAKRLEEEERLRIQREEEAKIREAEEAEKKAKDDEEKKKAGAKVGAKTGKSKGGSKGGAEKKSDAKKGAKEGKAKEGKGKEGKGKEGKGKAGKKGGKKAAEPPPPPEAVIDEKEIAAREFREYMQKEFMLPIIETSLVQADYIILAKAGQRQLENRPVLKQFFSAISEWQTPISAPMPRSIWLSSSLNAAGYLDQEGILNSFDLTEGTSTSVTHLGTKPPFEKIPLLGGACDSKLNRLYILNKKWVLEVWYLFEKTAAPIKRLKVLSKTVGYDYIQKYLQNPQYELLPNLISIADSGAIIINSTCADGFLYCFEPISLTLLWRSRLALDEMKVSKNLQTLYEEFEVYKRECIREGFSEEKLYEALDVNKTGKVSSKEFVQQLEAANLLIKDSLVKMIFKVLDPKSLNFVYLDKLFAGRFIKPQEFVKYEMEGRNQALLPEWVNNIHANEAVKECMCKVAQVMDKKNISSASIIEKLKDQETGEIVELVAQELFRAALTEVLSPEITKEDIDLIINVTDRDASGQINSLQFFSNLSSKKLAPGNLGQLSSQNLPRSSLKYVLHKSIELGIDLYKKCKDLDSSLNGTLPKDVFSSMLLILPIGIDTQSLSMILDRDLTYNSIGHIDYLEIFERQEYYQLIIQSKRANFLMPPVQEEAAVVQDFVYMQDLGLIAFATLNPVSSIIYLKDLNGELIARLVGHFGSQPPLLYFCKASNVLISGETREKSVKCEYDIQLPPCEILIWNLQNDLLNKYKYHPPWVIRPFKVVKAHAESLRDITYLPLTQLIASCGADGYIKLWNPTGVPMALSESESLPISDKTDSNFTESNKMMACVKTLQCENCYRLKTALNEHAEFFLCISFDLQNNNGNLSSWAFQRFQLSVPARQHDWEVAESVQNQADQVCRRYRALTLTSFKERAKENVENFQSFTVQEKEYETRTQKAVVKAVIFDGQFEEILNCIENKPGKKHGVSIEEFYNALVKYAGFYSITYAMYVFMLNDIQDKHFMRRITNKREAELVSLLRSLQEKYQAQEDSGVAEMQAAVFKCISQSLQDSSKSAYDLLSKIDLNQDKALNTDEFLEFLRKINLNLRKTEATCIMKSLNDQNSTTLKIQELSKRLESVGYKDPFYTNYYEYLWQDYSIQSFIKKFRKQHKFRNYYEFFTYFDDNSDGYLTVSNLYTALTSVTRKHGERLFNISISTINSYLHCYSLGKIFETFEKQQMLVAKAASNSSAMQICIKNFNCLNEISHSVSEIEKIGWLVLKNINTGIEIHARKYRLEQGLRIMREGRTLFQELVDGLIAVGVSRINGGIGNRENGEHGEHGSQTKSEEISIESVKITEFTADDVQIVWENDQEIREGEGKIISSGIGVIAVGYSLENSAPIKAVEEEVKHQIMIQEKCEGVLKCLGVFRSAAELVVLYKKPEGQSLKHLLENYGGVLQIPILKKIKATALVLSTWGSQILSILEFLHHHSISARSLCCKNLYISPSGSQIFLKLQGLGYLNDSNTLLSPYELTSFPYMYSQDFLPPECFVGSQQSDSTDVWSFAIVMLELMFGERIKGFLKSYEDWGERKNVRSGVAAGKVLPAKNFYYCPMAEFEIKAGVPWKCAEKELNLIKSMKKASFSGIISEFELASDPCAEMKQMIQELKAETQLGLSEKSTLGAILDVMSQCLNIDPHKRPKASEMLISAVFSHSSAELERAKSLSKIIFKHKNPDLVVSKFITHQLTGIEQDFSVARAEEVNELILNLKITLLSYDDNVIKDTIDAVNSSEISSIEKDEMISRNLVFPSTELFNKCIEDDIFMRISQLSLMFAQKQEYRIIESYSILLKNILDYVNSIKFPILLHSSSILKSFLCLYTGSTSPNPVSLSYWKPETYSITSSVLKELFTAEGLATAKYPALSTLLSSSLHSVYISELQVLSENLSVLKNPESNLFQKINSFRSFRACITSNNEHKLKAAVDMKFPQLILPYLQDDDPKIRTEALELFYEISKNCRDRGIRVQDVRNDVKIDRICRYLSLMGAEGRTTQVAKLYEDLAACFSSAMFIIPIARLVKLKAETNENKETGIKALINCLQGSEEVQRACLNPMTDTLSVICSTLTAFSRTGENKSGKGSAEVIQEALERFLATAQPIMLKAFRLAPGADVVLKEQALKIPDTVNLAGLLKQVQQSISIDEDPDQFIIDFKNWLQGVYKPGLIEIDPVFVCTGYLQSLVNSFWGFIEAALNKSKGFQLSSEQRKGLKAKIRKLLTFFEWLIENELDLGWFEDINNIEWVIEKSLKSIEHSGFDYDSYPFEEEGVICLRILCRLLPNTKLSGLLEKVVYGKVFTMHLKQQLDKLKELMIKQTDAFAILELNREQSKIRLSSFNRLVQYPQLRSQLLETNFCEGLIRDFLSDKKHLNIQMTQYVSEFFSFQELFPVRYEAMKMILKVFKSKTQMPELFENLIENMRVHRTIVNEIKNINDQNPLLSVSSIEFLNKLTKAAESDISGLLIQAEAAKSLRGIFETNPKLRDKFYELQEYANRISE